MDRLPDEVFCEIASYLTEDPCEMVRLRAVNRKWAACLDSPATWSSLHRIAIDLKPAKSALLTYSTNAITFWFNTYRDAIYVNGKRRSLWRCSDLLTAILRRALCLKQLWIGYKWVLPFNSFTVYHYIVVGNRCTREELLTCKELIGTLLRAAVLYPHLARIQSLAIYQKDSFEAGFCLLIQALGMYWLNIIALQYRLSHFETAANYAWIK